MTRCTLRAGPLLGILAWLALSSAACGGDSRSPVSPTTPDPMSIRHVIEALFLGAGRAEFVAAGLIDP